jgi:hypothetical protein
VQSETKPVGFYDCTWSLKVLVRGRLIVPDEPYEYEPQGITERVHCSTVFDCIPKGLALIYHLYRDLPTDGVWLFRLLNCLASVIGFKSLRDS